MALRYRYICLSMIGILLLGYFLAGKGFARIGISAIYIGEVVLILSCITFVVVRDFRIIFRSNIIVVLIIFNLWCFYQTVPYISVYGMDALRDAVIYGYSMFAFLVAACAFNAQVIARTVGYYAAVMYPAVILLPLMELIMNLSEYDFGIVPLVYLKQGDVAVCLAGAMTFHLLGLAPRRWGGALGQALFFVAWGTTAFLVSTSRSGILAILVALSVVFIFGYGRRQLSKFAALGVVVILIAALLDFGVEQERRDLSVDQLILSVTSIFDPITGLGESRGGYDNLSSTVNWRLAWWGAIVDETFYGDYFWNGVGFGINLADDDGFQTDLTDRSLRSPHNASMTILARSGVPGLALWLLLQGMFVYALASQAIRLRNTRYSDWSRLNVWILAYWSALFVNGSFDVYLEGPQGGIWYWSVMGFGIAVVTVEKLTDDSELAGDDLPQAVGDKSRAATVS